MARSLHTQTAARNSVSKHRVGRDWVVTWWDAGREIWRETHNMDYWTACQYITDHMDSVRRGDFEGKA